MMEQNDIQFDVINNPTTNSLFYCNVAEKLDDSVYLTDDEGNILTDDEGNRLIEG